MTVLTNPKHELFAHELAKGASQADAYETAGFKRCDGHAARLEELHQRALHDGIHQPALCSTGAHVRGSWTFHALST